MKKTAAKKTTKPRATIVHKKHSQQFLKVYWPYLPLFILVFFGLTFGYSWGPSVGNITPYSSKGVLAYATEMSASGLLSATNSERANHGSLGALTLNAKLSAAAQAKANDMVARNYWSHTTPDGKDPWVFIDATGYSFQKAGENLAYGFATSSDTVIGWMNSPSHRANMLDSAYKEVGFGFANASSYVGTGEETIVVAMYASPTQSTVQSATTAPTAAPQKTTQAPTTQQATPAQPTNADTTVPAAPVTEKPKKISDDRVNQPITSDSEIPAAQPATRITKLQSLTSGQAPWSAAVLSGVLVLVVGAWVTKHALIVKRVFVDGEQFILHHPLIDVAVLIVVGIAILLSQSSGVIK